MTLTLLEHSIMVDVNLAGRDKVERIAKRFNCEISGSGVNDSFYVRFNYYEDAYKFMLELTDHYMSISIE